MPFISVKTNLPVSIDKEEEIKTQLGKAITLIPGKSETWLMVAIEPESHLYFQGNKEPAAMVKVELYGSSSKSNYSNLTKEISNILNNVLKIDLRRIYVKYEEIDNWGFAGSNF